MLNTVINNQYKILKKINEGGMCNVFLAQDIINNKEIVVRSLKNQVLSNKIHDIIRFQNEASLISRLNHSNIVKVYGIAEIENNHCIIMEYIHGNSLYKLLRTGKKYNVDEVIEIITQICKALEHIHNAHIIHRDLKPGNIMIEGEQKEKNNRNKKKLHIKLIDFGLSQAKDFCKIKEQEEIVGTFSYMAPEQFGISGRRIDERSDLYSLGIIFYQLLTNTLIFESSNISTIIHQHIAQLPDPPSVYNEKIPSVLYTGLIQSLFRKPLKRDWSSIFNKPN